MNCSPEKNYRNELTSEARGAEHYNVGHPQVEKSNFKAGTSGLLE
jgi:poly-gamma-glutamate capsule biosynthesis protein CapA/YwtB (metallophosphatase superfamily)